MDLRGLLRGAAAVLWLACLPPPAGAAERIGPADAAALVKRKAIIPLKTVVAKAEKLKAGRLLEADLRRKKGVYVYHVEIIDAAGTVWELKFNAADGGLLELEEEND